MWSGIGAAALSAASAYAMNQASLKNQNAVNDLNINLANTAHQREVADLRLAGLNPILSAGGQGAASNVAQASAQFDNPLAGLSDAINSSRLTPVKKQLLEIQGAQASANIGLMTSQGQVYEHTADKLAADAELARKRSQFLTSKEGMELWKQQLRKAASATPTQLFTEVLNEFGGAKGVADFIRNRFLSSPGDSKEKEPLPKKLKGSLFFL